ncbi:uncharacterized protein EI90DRAFT_454420 [Cantharellus anzutake]|uniref:uncharacterized protein n=1 Tax=Cantharellus anzutake TaxID=1750568 RepID=UPI0019045919|nr:uncharacterized protein EI90DRAFT_454420 [Cantharellus anzutake]KAF8334699.1 hypothetical protein EI90DRAFT_454420 [Cantharellus anzutake]
MRRISTTGHIADPNLVRPGHQEWMNKMAKTWTANEAHTNHGQCLFWVRSIAYLLLLYRSEDAYQPLASHYTHHVYPSTHDPTSRAYLHLPPPPGRGTYQYSPAHRNQVHPHHSVIQPYPYPMAPDVPLYTANPSPQMPHAQVGYSSGPSGPPLHSRTPTHLNGHGSGRREDDRSSNRSRRSSVSDRGFNPGSDEWTTEKMWE